jgi:hypothetical protein
MMGNGLGDTRGIGLLVAQPDEAPIHLEMVLATDERQAEGGIQGRHDCTSGAESNSQVVDPSSFRIGACLMEIARRRDISAKRALDAHVER